MNGEVVAWRNRVGDRWHYCERDPREVHDNGKQTDALVLATDYAALQAERDEIEAMNQQQALRLMAQESARIAAEAKLDAVTKERDALREKVLSAIPSNWCDPLLTGDGSALGKAPWGCPEIERLLLGIRERIAALTDQGRAGEGDRG